MTRDPKFKGYIHDVGGPTADFRQPACKKQLSRGACQNRQCLFPTPCRNLIADHSDYLALLRKLRAIPGVKKVFIRSGIRFDYVLADPSDVFFKELVRYHISGQLKVAPEHVSDAVLEKMGKPKHSVYLRFAEKYAQLNQQERMNQFLVPYLAPRLHNERRRRAGRISARYLPPARAGAGLLSHALDAFDRHVLYGA